MKNEIFKKLDKSLEGFDEEFLAQKILELYAVTDPHRNNKELLEKFAEET